MKTNKNIAKNPLTFSKGVDELDILSETIPYKEEYLKLKFLTVNFIIGGEKLHEIKVFVNGDEMIIRLDLLNYPMKKPNNIWEINKGIKFDKDIKIVVQSKIPFKLLLSYQITYSSIQHKT